MSTRRASSSASQTSSSEGVRGGKSGGAAEGEKRGAGEVESAVKMVAERRNLSAMAWAKSETSDLSSAGGRETASVQGSAAAPKKSIEQKQNSVCHNIYPMTSLV